MHSDDEQKTTFTVRHVKATEKQPPNRDAQRTFSLRIPASTLLEVGQSTEILLEAFPDSNEVTTGMLRKSHDVHEEDEKLSVRIEPDSTRIYRKNSENELVHERTVHQRLSIESTKEVEILGRKARERLEEEQRKRREIVRLEADPEGISQARKAGAAFANAIRKQRPRPSSASKRKLTERFSDSFPESTSNVDCLTPSISHISLCPVGERSSVIRIHGLPKSVRPESIRRFFSGLEVERVFVLLTNRSRIPNWDERKPSSQTLVERHEPSFRVYVKFASAPVGDMALARSEEFLSVDEEDEKINVRIGMTKVSKTIANYLQNNLAIDGVNGRPLSETLMKEEARLGPRVSSFLWTMAHRDLHIPSSPQTSQEGDIFEAPWNNNPSLLNPLGFSQYQKLTEHNNFLVDEYEEMERSRLSLDMKEWDPKLSNDVVMRLKRAASDRLLEEIENVQLILYRVRVERRRDVSSSIDNDK